MNFEVEFHALLNLFATNAKVQINQTMLRVYDIAISPYGYEVGVAALQSLMLETKIWQMPTPNSIIEKIKNKPARVSDANEIAGRIMESLSEFGYSHSLRAREYIGDLGWMVVKRFGGWAYLCSEVGVTLNTSTTRAQLREMALSLMDINEKRGLDEAPQLEAPAGGRIQSAISLIANAKSMPK